MKKHIFKIKSGSKNFSDSNHLKNFVRYLFSNSRGHQPGEYTKFNFFKYGDKEVFVDNNSEDMKEFNKFLKFSNIPFDKLKNDLYYFPFIIENNGNLITNMFTIKDNELQWDISPEILDIIISDYFSSNPSDFENNLNEIITKCEKCHYYYDLSVKNRTFIERLIQEDINKDITLILSISHHDQDLFHVHRIYMD
jgi:hypothetical protein